MEGWVIALSALVVAACSAFVVMRHGRCQNCGAFATEVKDYPTVPIGGFSGTVQYERVATCVDCGEVKYRDSKTYRRPRRHNKGLTAG